MKIMNKKLVLPFIIPMAIGLLSGCSIFNGNSGMKLTYGTYITTDDNSINDAKEIDFTDLSMRMDRNQEYAEENFLLVIAPTNGCSCWVNFQPVLKNFIKSTNYLVYTIKITEFGDEKYGLTMKQGYVSFSIIKAGKVLKTYLSGSSSIFDSSDALKAEVKKYVRDPDMYYVDEERLDYAIKHGENVLVDYVRCNCSDCNYATPHALWPAAQKNDFKTKMLIFDMEDLKATLSADDYQEFKDVHYLSEKLNPEYGYGGGVVPTIHYYYRGVLTDATVFFNDKIQKVGNEYMVMTSFYSQERLHHIKYAQDLETPVLEGLIIPESDLVEGTTYWRKEKAYKYHKPLFDSFMKTYAFKS